MNQLIRSTLLLGAITLALAVPATCFGQQQRQNRGQLDPEQARARMMERYRTGLHVADDSEWNAIEPRVQKVLDARRELGGGMGMAMGFRGGRGAGNNNDQADATQSNRRGRRGNAQAQDDQGAQRRRGPQLSPAAQDLRQAVESKASAEDIKAKLTTYREERKQKQAKLQAAQDDLRKVLSVSQEASAVLMGLLD